MEEGRTMQTEVEHLSKDQIDYFTGVDGKKLLTIIPPTIRKPRKTIERSFVSGPIGDRLGVPSMICVALRREYLKDEYNAYNDMRKCLIGEGTWSDYKNPDWMVLIMAIEKYGQATCFGMIGFADFKVEICWTHPYIRSKGVMQEVFTNLFEHVGMITVSYPITEAMMRCFNKIAENTQFYKDEKRFSKVYDWHENQFDLCLPEYEDFYTRREKMCIFRMLSSQLGQMGVAVGNGETEKVKDPIRAIFGFVTKTLQSDLKGFNVDGKADIKAFNEKLRGCIENIFKDNPEALKDLKERSEGQRDDFMKRVHPEIYLKNKEKENAGYRSF